MTTTTSYGTWYNHQGGELNIETSVVVALGDYADDHDVDAIAADWSKAINEALPPNVALTGDEFIGPAYAKDQEFDGYPMEDVPASLEGEVEGALDIKAIVESVDFWAIAERHQLLTLEDIGRDLLKSQAKEPAKTASKTMHRLGVKPAVYRPHPDSGRPQAVYRAGDVKEALTSRPGQGARTDRKASA
ncbi:hypothetical protein [Streptomyces sp. V1I6]|uniref:hypothetical protein n=1 Tax=Streptomyces sp. V1I6 TaxID=3042273 RepID=UPI00277EECA5|nr:hypothetical protein [Streptomyces sp. V1I6]MDQ0842383.1 hypothetical protein [Streptomyces sp. V1I6]